MEVGCGGTGLRTSEGKVVNLYFWHLEREGSKVVRREEFIGRADSVRSKRDLLRRMAEYNLRIERQLAKQRSKIEQELRRA